jgi:CheY-like chemotaxis protein
MKRILIVDDCRVSTRLFMALLETPGYELSVASNGLDALRACEKARPDLILLDLSLPEMDGFEVARRIKGDGRTRDIPIIAVTAYGHDEATDEALEAGADHFMTKPFSGVVLRETVAALVDAR